MPNIKVVISPNIPNGVQPKAMDISYEKYIYIYIYIFHWKCVIQQAEVFNPAAPGSFAQI